MGVGVSYERGTPAGGKGGREGANAAAEGSEKGFWRSLHRGTPPPQENKYFTDVRSCSEADWYSRLIDFVYHTTQGLRMIKKKKRGWGAVSTCASRMVEAQCFGV